MKTIVKNLFFVLLFSVISLYWFWKNAPHEFSIYAGFSKYLVDVPQDMYNKKDLYALHDVVVELPTGVHLKVGELFAAYQAVYSGTLSRGMLLDRKRVPHTIVKWKNMPIQQQPGDLLKLQHFIFSEKPDVIIEFGTDTGGTAVFFSEIMTTYNPLAHVITIDLSSHINKSIWGFEPTVLASSSPHWGSVVHHIVGHPTSPDVVAKVTSLLTRFNATNVFLVEDSDHTYSSVMSNLMTYQHLVQPCGWILVQDTNREDGASSAVKEFVKAHHDFRVERTYETCCGGTFTEHVQGWLHRKLPHQTCNTASH